MGTETRKDVPARYLILGLLIVCVVVIVAYCSASGGVAPSQPPTACPSDLTDNRGPVDAFSDGFQQGLTNCR